MRSKNYFFTIGLIQFLFLLMTTNLVASKHTFTPFDTGTITYGIPNTNPLTVSGLTGTYLFYTITADFVPADPSVNSMYSDEIKLGLNNGGSTVYKVGGVADIGSAYDVNATTLRWSGELLQPYTGGDNLNVEFTDISVATMTASLSNVTVTIYVAPDNTFTPLNTFTPFDTGTITYGIPNANPLTVSGLTGTYLFYTITADFVPADPSVNSMYSSEIKLELNNGGLTVYKAAGVADIGSADDVNATTLEWTGVMLQPYTGGDNLNVKFTDISAATMTASLSNVSITVYSEPPLTPLPIELLSFSATATISSVEVNWQTASETNNDFFTIERSKDGYNWDIIEKIGGAGNSNTILSYRTKDITPYSGISYYRLKQTDFDGQYDYSQAVSVYIERIEPQVVIYPNPTRSRITVVASRSELMHIAIFNVLGYDVTRFTKKIALSESAIVMDLADLSSGMYTLRTEKGAHSIFKQ